MKDVENYYCTNPDCSDYQMRGRGNLNAGFTYGKHGRRMLYCRTCKSRFSETKCTPFFNSKYSAETIGAILRCTAEGVGVRNAKSEIQNPKSEPERTGNPGRPRSPVAVVDEDLDYATVHKTREKGRVVKVEKRVIYGDEERIKKRLGSSPSKTINTSFEERLNGILRQMDAHLRRKSLTFAKALRWFEAKLAFVVAAYNFLRPHTTLSRNPDRSTTPRSPAMAASLTDHLWSLEELLTLPVMQ